MITMHILQFLSDNGFGTIDQNLWFENMPLDKYGLLIVSTGGIKARGRRTETRSFDIYCRDQLSNVEAMEKLENVIQLLAASYGSTCTLPSVPGYSDRTYSRVVFDDISDIQNLGENQNGRVLYRIGANITFNKES